MHPHPHLPSHSEVRVREGRCYEFRAREGDRHNVGLNEEDTIHTAEEQRSHLKTMHDGFEV